VAKHNEKFQMIHMDAGSALIDLVDKAGPLGNSSSNSNSDNTDTVADTASYQKMDHICLGLTSFDEPAIRDHLLSHGVKITTEIGVRYGKNGYGESLYFEDPEGTRIEIKKSGLL
jgi:glyoxylase I family protein